MKSFLSNFGSCVLLTLLICGTAHADDDPDVIIYPPEDPAGLIYEFFADNPSNLYFMGIRHFYLGSEFGLVFKNGDFEDRFTNLMFIMPFGGKDGIVIEVDGEDVLDAFLFEYDPIGYESSSIIANRFELKDLFDDHPLLPHRYDVLRQVDRVRFQLDFLAGINTYLLLYGIEIK